MCRPTLEGGLCALAFFAQSKGRVENIDFVSRPARNGWAIPIQSTFLLRPARAERAPSGLGGFSADTRGDLWTVFSMDTKHAITQEARVPRGEQ